MIDKEKLTDCDYLPSLIAQPFEHLAIGRIDNVVQFECSKCHALMPSEDGGDKSEEDPNGDLCSRCFCERAVILGTL